MTKSLLAVLLLATAGAAYAQPAPVAPPPAVAPAQDEGLTGEVTDESAWQDLGIAIPAFATNANQPTPANAQGTGALGGNAPTIIDDQSSMSTPIRAALWISGSADHLLSEQIHQQEGSFAYRAVTAAGCPGWYGDGGGTRVVGGHVS